MKTYDKPIFFKSNRVRRVYKGGKLFSQFFGDDSCDGNYPEEWVCSVTRALNSGSNDEYEGISQTVDGEYFSELMQEHKRELIGDREEFGLLVKILDSAIRLPAQVHPDKEFSKKHFNSNHGKTESWIILATRENACVYFGFNKEITKEELFEALNSNEEVLLPLLNRIPVKEGDVFLIPAKAVHAIGAGCLILEVQEPTDFTVQPERMCGDYALNDYEKYLGLPHDVAMECFDMSFMKEDAERYSQTGVIDSPHLITKNDTPCFSINRYIIKGENEQTLTGPAVYITIAGEGEICGESYNHKIKKGDYFFMPYDGREKYKIKGDGLTVVECIPPEN